MKNGSLVPYTKVWNCAQILSCSYHSNAQDHLIRFLKFWKECCFPGIRALSSIPIILNYFLFHKILGPIPACFVSFSWFWNAEEKFDRLNACSLKCLREISASTWKHTLLLCRFCLQELYHLQHRENMVNETVREIIQIHEENHDKAQQKEQDLISLLSMNGQATPVSPLDWQALGIPNSRIWKSWGVLDRGLNACTQYETSPVIISFMGHLTVMLCLQFIECVAVQKLLNILDR